MRKETRLFIRIFYISIIIVIGYLIFNFKLVFINGQSMAPTLRDGQITLLYKNAKNYKVGDIVNIETEEYGICVKRILAKPGDIVEQSNGKIYRNEILLSEYKCKNHDEKYTLKEDEYFVLGDNYNASIDSREFGPVKLEDIQGKVLIY